MNLHEIAADGEWMNQLAQSACIRLSDAERSMFVLEISDMLSALDGMVDPVAAEVQSPVAVPENQLREDVAEPCLPREAVLCSARQQNGEYFVVPRAVGACEGRA